MNTTTNHYESLLAQSWRVAFTPMLLLDEDLQVKVYNMAAVGLLGDALAEKGNAHLCDLLGGNIYDEDQFQYPQASFGFPFFFHRYSRDIGVYLKNESEITWLRIHGSVLAGDESEPKWGMLELFNRNVDRRLYEEKGRAESKFQNLSDRISDLHFILDDQLQFVHWNTAFATYHQLKPYSGDPVPYYDLQGIHHTPPLADHIRNVFFRQVASSFIFETDRGIFHAVVAPDLTQVCVLLKRISENSELIRKLEPR